MKTIVSSLEPLEARIAPAAVVVSYTDVDGDLVKITDSTGHLTFSDLIFVGGGTSGQLAELNLTGEFAGANITFSVVYKAGGNGLANVGYIDAGTNNLGVVTVKGDLGRIDAGSGHGTAIQSLVVDSLGRLGVDPQQGLASLTLSSNIDGGLGALTVTHDDTGASIVVSNGGIGPITIGGSLLGGAANYSGAINSGANIGPVKIGQDVQGGGGSSSGNITATGNLTSVTIGGSLLGGSGFGSGLISTDDVTMGAVKIGQDVEGGGDSLSGSITSNGNLTSVTIGGSLLGGSGPSSGQIQSNGNIGPVKIVHNLQGGAGSGAGVIDTGAGALSSIIIGGSLLGGAGSGSGVIHGLTAIGAIAIGGSFKGGSISGTTPGLDSSGLIECVAGNIASVAIGGSIVSGTDTSTQGALTNNASIRAAHEIGSLTVAGSIIGNPDGGVGDAASPVVISAGGQAGAVAPHDVAIGKITIGGRIDDTVILAGYDPTLSPVSADAQIGAVKVGGDWIASDLVAGATNSNTPTGAPFPNFGDANDASIGGGPTGLISKMASLTIGGQVLGTLSSVSSTDHYGFVAQAIGPVKIGGYAIAIAAGNNPQPVGETGDVDIHVIA
jgi:hypothetical protein